MITFFVTAYGETYLPYLETLLQSIDEVYSGTAHIVVHYANIPEVAIEQARKKLTCAEFQRIERLGAAQAADSLSKRIPGKLESWERFVRESDAERIVCLDADMLVLDRLDAYFDREADVVYTYKTDTDENLRWPLNTGIVLINNSEASRRFMDWWREATVAITLDDSRMETAGSDWGAADQCALGEMLDYKNLPFPPPMKRLGGARLVGVPCRELNETRCVPVTASTHVIHYKGRWRAVLPDGAFTEFRPREKCLAMFELWKNTHLRWQERSE